MAFVDALIDESDADVVMVDRASNMEPAMANLERIRGHAVAAG